MNNPFSHSADSGFLSTRPPIKDSLSSPIHKTRNLWKMARCRLLAMISVMIMSVMICLHWLNGGAMESFSDSGADFAGFMQPQRLRTAGARMDQQFDARSMDAWKVQMMSALNAHQMPGSTKEYEMSKLAIMPQLGNATIRADLGRATWRLLHTMASRFPVVPTHFEQAALELFVVLLSRLYPCGECASEFQKLIHANPPNVSYWK